MKKRYIAFFETKEYFYIPIEANNLEEAVKIASKLNPDPEDYEMIQLSCEVELHQVVDEEGKESISL